MPAKYLLIDGKDKILGRLASEVAKLAMLGRHVVVINAKDIVISGSKKWIFNEYIRKKNIKTLTNPRRGPFFHRRPDALFRRTVRGMLPFKQNRGQEAFKRVHVYADGLGDKKYPKLTEFNVDHVGADRLGRKYITLEDLGKRFGWTNPVQ